ncbi:universal stress protein [Gloeobacter morelensis MG652769]|uniref:Universal stress protein n=2 Tax=Gloeobacter TaxID=33071 RepID=A0ABY3PMF7_9CYAN|nr:universal stress protein [Gloeobacter morelensis MG652769]
MDPMQKILAAFDSSETGSAVFGEALDLARATGAHLLLLHVLSSDEEGSPSLPITFASQLYPSLDDEPLKQYLDHWKAFERRGLELLNERQVQAEAQGVSVDIHQASGNPGRKICDLARAQQVDLIVLGRRGRSTLSEVLLGSVSHYVLHHAPCSVYVVHRKARARAAAAETAHNATN